MKTRKLSQLIPLALFGGTATLVGDDLVYTGAAGSNWSHANNWNPGNIPDGLAHRVVLDAGLKRLALALSGAGTRYSVGQIQMKSPESALVTVRSALASPGVELTLDPSANFNDIGVDMIKATKSLHFGTTSAWSLRLGSSQKWEISSSTPGVALCLEDSSPDKPNPMTLDLGANTLTAEVVADSDPDFAKFQIDVANTGKLNIIGSGGIVKSGPGIMHIGGTHRFRGGLRIDAGCVQVAPGASALGAGEITLNATGTKLLVSSADADITTGSGNSLIVADKGDVKSLASQGAGRQHTFSGTISIDEISPGNFVVDVGNNNTLTLGGSISSTGATEIRMSGNGKVVLTGDNTYAGDTVVVAGTLIINNTTGSGAGSGSVVVSGGAKLGGNGSIVGDVLMKSDCGLLASITDWNGAAGSGFADLSVGNITIESGRHTITIDTTGLANFTESAKKFTLVNAVAVSGFSPEKFSVTPDAGFPGKGQWMIEADARTITLVYSPAHGRIGSSTEPPEDSIGSSVNTGNSNPPTKHKD